MNPKQVAQSRVAELEAELLAARIEAAATFPVDTELLLELVAGMTPEELEKVPYLPGRK